MKLYELTDAYKSLWEMVDNDESDSTMIQNALQTVNDAIEVKAGNIVIFLQSLDIDAKTIKEEEARLSARRKAIENKRDNIKRYLQEQMELLGVDKLKTSTHHSLSIQNNPPAVQIINEDEIPGKFLTLIPEQYIPDKKAIAKALKDGQKVPGAELQTGKSLRIR